MRYLLAAAVTALCITAAHAQPVGIAATDTTESVLSAQKGKRVTVRLMSGQEMTGTVREATPKLVVLSSLAGRELFDAVIPLEAIEAVLIRNK